MGWRKGFLAACGLASVLVVPLLAAAAGPMDLYRGRKGKWEITLQPRYLTGETVGFSGGSSIKIDDDLGFGMGFGYNLTDRFALHLDWSWSNVDYKATIATTDAIGNPTGTDTYSGELDTSTVALNLTAHLLEGPVTPFVVGGIGWTYVDSNIPSGPPSGSCWWDPWYGYICTSYQDTYGADEFSYSLGIGVRADVSPGFFLRGSWIWQWVDFSRSAGTSPFDGGRLDIGFSF